MRHFPKGSSYFYWTCAQRKKRAAGRQLCALTLRSICERSRLEEVKFLLQETSQGLGGAGEEEEEEGGQRRVAVGEALRVP